VKDLKGAHIRGESFSRMEGKEGAIQNFRAMKPSEVLVKNFSCRRKKGKEPGKRGGGG